MNQEFLDYVDDEMSKNGAIQLTPAIKKFIQPTDLTIDRHVAFLHGTGKYVIVRGLVTQNLIVERNPNYDTGKSVVETNKSVRITNRFLRINSRRQNRLTIASIIVAGASALFAFGATYATLKDSTGEEVRGLKLQLQKQSQSLEQISQFQKEINASLKSFVERSLPKGKDSLNNVEK